MKGLLWKDLYNLSGQLRMYIVFPIMGLFLSYTNKDLEFMSFLFAMLIISTLISSFAYDDMADFNTYALAFPIRKLDMVLSKYVLSLIMLVVSIVLYMVMVVLLTLLFGADYFGGVDYVQSFIFIVATVCSLEVVCCILMPLLFKYGSEKGRIMLFAFFMAIAAGGFILNAIFGTEGLLTFMSFLDGMGIYVIAVLAIVLVLFIAGSIYVSNRILMKKEF